MRLIIMHIIILTRKFTEAAVEFNWLNKHCGDKRVQYCAAVHVWHEKKVCMHVIDEKLLFFDSVVVKGWWVLNLSCEKFVGFG